MQRRLSDVVSLEQNVGVSDEPCDLLGALLERVIIFSPSKPSWELHRTMEPFRPSLLFFNIALTECFMPRKALRTFIDMTESNCCVVFASSGH